MACPRSSSVYMELSQAEYVSKIPKILLAACGTMAAVGFSEVCHYFVEWTDVKAVATRAALHFLDKASLPEDVDLYTDEDEWSTWKRLGDNILHVELQRWADIMVIAPTSANTLAKIAGGLCDNLLTCIVRCWDHSKPIFVAPDMDPLMWKNNLTERHCMELDDFGIFLIPPVARTFPDGQFGTGAMDGPSQINSAVKNYVRSNWQSSSSSSRK